MQRTTPPFAANPPRSDCNIKREKTGACRIQDCQSLNPVSVCQHRSSNASVWRRSPTRL